jgi:hypothetical protein
LTSRMPFSMALLTRLSIASSLPDSSTPAGLSTYVVCTNPSMV